MLSRRTFLAGVSSTFALTALTKRARADGPSPSPAGAPVASRVLRVARDTRGVTVTMELEHAPFPSPGGAYRDPTVIAFIPEHHRPVRDAGVAVVVLYHGHNSTAERAMVAHQLREQLYDSKQNAILVVPQLAVTAPDSAAGKLETHGGFARMVGDALRTLDVPQVRGAAGLSAIPESPEIGRVCVSAHSGGYHAAAASLKEGGLAVREVYLFDALYAESDVFRDWVVAGAGKSMGARHKLVSYYTGGATETNTKALFAELEKDGVYCANEVVEGTLSREDLTHAEAVSIKTSLTHGAVTSELNSLRDCLYASALKRRLRSSWFDTKQGARPLERRR